MIRRLAVLLFLTLSACCVLAQERAPSALFEATQCLLTGKYAWLEEVKDQKELHVAYHADNKTFNGLHYLNVIVYTSPKRDQGKIFDIQEKEHHTYVVENNAQFKLNHGEITFTEPPLGGTFRENQLRATIQQVLKHKKWYEAQMKALMKPSPKLNCQTVVEDVVHPEQKRAQ